MEGAQPGTSCTFFLFGFSKHENPNARSHPLKTGIDWLATCEPKSNINYHDTCARSRATSAREENNTIIPDNTTIRWFLPGLCFHVFETGSLSSVTSCCYIR